MWAHAVMREEVERVAEAAEAAEVAEEWRWRRWVGRGGEGGCCGRRHSGWRQQQQVRRSSSDPENLGQTGEITS